MAVKQVTRDALIDEIQRLKNELDRTPVWRDMEVYGEYDTAPYDRHFDSWNGALIEAGLEPNQRHVQFRKEGDVPTDVDGRDAYAHRLDIHHKIEECQLADVEVEELAEVWGCTPSHAKDVLHGRSGLRFRDYLAALSYAQEGGAPEDADLTDREYRRALHDIREDVAEHFTREQASFMFPARHAYQKLLKSGTTLYAAEAHLLKEAVSRARDGESAEAILTDISLRDRS